MSQIKKGAFLNYATIIVTNLVGLLLTPFIIQKLGDAEFGLYTMIGSFVGYISILDFGLANTVVRFVAKYRSEKDSKGQENFLATTLIIYSIISLLVILIGSICYINIENIFADSLQPQEIEKAKIMFGILIFALAIGLPGGALEGICYGYERFVYPKSVKLIRYIVRSLLVVAILSLGGKAVSMVILDVVLNVVLIIFIIFYVFRNLKVRIRLHKFNPELLKKIFGYSVWIFVFVLVGQFQWQVGQLVLGIVANTTVVAIFAVGVMLGTYYGAFSTAISGLFLPRATQMTVSEASPQELTDMMIKIGRISFIILMYILGAFTLFGKQFIFLWVGDSYADSWIIAIIIMLAYTLPLVQGFGNSILEARNKLRFKALIYLSFLILGTVFGGYLAKSYGAVGMITGTVSGWLIGQNIMNIYYYKVIELELFRFFRELLSKTLVALLIVLFLGFWINYLPGKGWFNFILKAGLFSICYFTIIYRFGINNYEKKLIGDTVRPVLSKFNIKFPND